MHLEMVVSIIGGVGSVSNDLIKVVDSSKAKMGAFVDKMVLILGSVSLVIGVTTIAGFSVMEVAARTMRPMKGS